MGRPLSFREDFIKLTREKSWNWAVFDKLDRLVEDLKGLPKNKQTPTEDSDSETQKKQDENAQSFFGEKKKLIDLL